MHQDSLFNDTIAAIATPLGRGGIGILRLSGPEAVTISKQLIHGNFPKVRVATYRDFIDVDGNTIDQGILLYFAAPNTFTGEEVVEFQGHGSPPALNALLKSAIARGARLARPGEFSERAFLNGRLDLTQAEAIADLIHAGSEQAARAAVQSLQGVFSEQIKSINQTLIHLRTLIEAAIDFSEEDVAPLSSQELLLALKDLLAKLSVLKKEAIQGKRLQAGLQLVIAGPPNAGKSSLLNALTGEETAIISPVSGTTRDVLTADLVIDGLPVYVLDTAGLHKTDNSIEQEGIRRALVAIEKADQILWVVDSTETASTNPHQVIQSFGSLEAIPPIAVVRNKIDLSGDPKGIKKQDNTDTIYVSAAKGTGLALLKAYLKQRVEYQETAIGFSARDRHIFALDQVEIALKDGIVAINESATLELIAVHLNEAHRTLGEIIGVFTTEDLLGNIFSSFCIGK